MTATSDATRSMGRELLLWGRLVKFSHTIFALPFALSMLVYVAATTSVSALQLAAILLALVAARTAAMSFNRLIDRDIDALNPRTKGREIPSGLVSVRSAWQLCFASVALFLLAAAVLGTHCLVLTPVVLAVLLGYSFAKRFTSFSHLILGLALALAPGGVWYALTAQVALLPIWMMLGIVCWVAGFDILYSCQDSSFDRQHALRSIPALLGNEAAFFISRFMHIAAMGFFGIFGYAAGLGAFYWTGLALFALLLLSQHRLVSPGNLARIDAAFFTRNGAASVVYFFAMLADVLW